MTTHNRARARRSLRAGITTVVAVAALLLGAAPAVAEEAAAATIAGTVTGDADGAPVEGVFVVAQTEDAGSIHTAYTAADGTYMIEGITPGDYRVKFEASGGNLIAEYWNNTTDYFQAEVLSVADGAALTGINAGLASGAVITGTVTRSDDGTPVEGVSVQASGDTYGSGRSQADGTYRIEGLAPGSYTVQFDGGGGLVGEYWNDARDWASAEQVVVEAGGQVDGIDAALDAGGDITGMITRASGEPLSGGSVSFYAAPYDGITDAVANAWVAEDGWYQSSTLPVGEYIVRFDGGAGTQYEYWNDAVRLEDATPVPVAAGETTGSIDAELAASAAISGSVTRDSDGAPVSGIVYASDADGFAATASLDSDGRYALDVQPGTYTLHFTSDDSALISEYWKDVLVRDQATPITVASGEQVTGIDAQLASASVISGTVTLSSTAANETFVEAYDADGRFAGMTYASTEDGSYAITLPAGTYTLKAAAVFYEDRRTTAKPQYWQGASNAKKATKLTVDAGETVSGIDFTLVAKTKGKAKS